MNTTTTPPLAQAAMPTSDAPATSARRRGLDVATRALHWTLALSFAGAYLTAEADGWMTAHQVLGYTAMAIAVLRILWGFFGPRERRWTQLTRRLAQAPAIAGAWLKAPTTSSALPAYHWLQTAITVGLIGLALLVGASGMGLTLGPWGEALEELHEGLGEAMLALVAVHLGLLLAMSLLRRRNLASSMLGSGGARSSWLSRGMALMVLIGVLGFWTWQWQQPSTFLMQGEHNPHHSGDHHEDDDD